MKTPFEWRKWTAAAPWLRLITGSEIVYAVLYFLSNAFFAFFGSCEWNGSGLWYPAFWSLPVVTAVFLLAAWTLYRVAEAGLLAIICALVPVSNFVILHLYSPKQPMSCISI